MSDEYRSSAILAVKMAIESNAKELAKEVDSIISMIEDQAALEVHLTLDKNQKTFLNELKSQLKTVSDAFGNLDNQSSTFAKNFQKAFENLANGSIKVDKIVNDVTQSEEKLAGAIKQTESVTNKSTQNTINWYKKRAKTYQDLIKAREYYQDIVNGKHYDKEKDNNDELKKYGKEHLKDTLDEMIKSGELMQQAINKYKSRMPANVMTDNTLEKMIQEYETLQMQISLAADALLEFNRKTGKDGVDKLLGDADVGKYSKLAAGVKDLNNWNQVAVIGMEELSENISKVLNNVRVIASAFRQLKDDEGNLQPSTFTSLVESVKSLKDIFEDLQKNPFEVMIAGAVEAKSKIDTINDEANKAVNRYIKKREDNYLSNYTRAKNVASNLPTVDSDIKLSSKSQAKEQMNILLSDIAIKEQELKDINQDDLNIYRNKQKEIIDLKSKMLQMYKIYQESLKGTDKYLGTSITTQIDNYVSQMQAIIQAKDSSIDESFSKQLNELTGVDSDVIANIFTKAQEEAKGVTYIVEELNKVIREKGASDSPNKDVILSPTLSETFKADTEKQIEELNIEGKAKIVGELEESFKANIEDKIKDLGITIDVDINRVTDETPNQVDSSTTPLSQVEDKLNNVIKEQQLNQLSPALDNIISKFEELKRVKEEAYDRSGENDTGFYQYGYPGLGNFNPLEEMDASEIKSIAKDYVKQLNSSEPSVKDAIYSFCEALDGMWDEGWNALTKTQREKLKNFQSLYKSEFENYDKNIDGALSDSFISDNLSKYIIDEYGKLGYNASQEFAKELAQGLQNNSDIKDIVDTAFIAGHLSPNRKPALSDGTTATTPLSQQNTQVEEQINLQDNLGRKIDENNSKLLQGKALLDEQTGQVQVLYTYSKEDFDQFDLTKSSVNGILGAGQYFNLNKNDVSINGDISKLIQTQWYAIVKSIFDTDKPSNIDSSKIDAFLQTYLDNASAEYVRKVYEEMKVWSPGKTISSKLSDDDFTKEFRELVASLLSSDWSQGVVNTVRELADGSAEKFVQMFETLGYDAISGTVQRAKGRIKEINVLNPNNLIKANQKPALSDTSSTVEETEKEISNIEKAFEQYKQKTDEYNRSAENTEEILSRLIPLFKELQKNSKGDLLSKFNSDDVDEANLSDEDLNNYIKKLPSSKKDIKRHIDSVLSGYKSEEKDMLLKVLSTYEGGNDGFYSIDQNVFNGLNSNASKQKALYLSQLLKDYKSEWQNAENNLNETKNKIIPIMEELFNALNINFENSRYNVQQFLNDRFARSSVEDMTVHLSDFINNPIESIQRVFDWNNYYDAKSFQLIDISDIENADKLIEKIGELKNTYSELQTQTDEQYFKWIDAQSGNASLNEDEEYNRYQALKQQTQEVGNQYAAYERLQGILSLITSATQQHQIPVLSGESNTSTPQIETDNSQELTKEQQALKELAEYIDGVITLVNEKTAAFEKEGQVVSGTVQEEITNLTVLVGWLEMLKDNISSLPPIDLKIDLNNFDIESINSELTDKLTELSKALEDIDTSKISSEGIEALNSLKIQSNLGENLQKVANAITNIKSSLNNLGTGGQSFVNDIKEILSSAEALKNFNEILKANKKERDEAVKQATQDKPKQKPSSVEGEKRDDIPEKANQHKVNTTSVKNSHLLSDSDLSDLGKQIEGEQQSYMDNLRKSGEFITDVTKFFDSANNLVKQQFKSTDNQGNSKTYTTRYSINKDGEAQVWTSHIDNTKKQEYAINKAWDEAIYINNELKKSEQYTQDYIQSLDEAYEYQKQEEEYIKLRNQAIEEGARQQEEFNNQAHNQTLLEAYEEAEEYQKQEEEYIKKRNQLLEEGKKQQEEYDNAMSEVNKQLAEEEKVANQQRQKQWESFNKESNLINQEQNVKVYNELTDAISRYSTVKQRVEKGNTLDGDIEEVQKLENLISELQENPILSNSQIQASERLLDKLLDKLIDIERQNKKTEKVYSTDEINDYYNNAIQKGEAYKQTQKELIEAQERYINEENQVNADLLQKARQANQEAKQLYDKAIKIINSEKVNSRLNSDQLARVNSTEASIKLNNDAIKKQIQETKKTYNEQLSDTLEAYNDKLEKLSKTSNVAKYPDTYKDVIVKIQENLTKLKSIGELNIISEEDIKDSEKLKETIKGLFDVLESADKLGNRAKASSLTANITQYINSLTKGGSLIKESKQELTLLVEQLRRLDITAPEISEIADRFGQIKTEINEAGKSGRGFIDIFKNKLKYGIAQQLAMYFSFNDIVRYARTAINTIIELDTSLVDLRKTTTMNGQELSQFYIDANTQAKNLGVTTQEIIQQAADWSRLGFSDAQSATTMAALSSQFASISPDMDVAQATDGMVSIIKAFDLSVEEVERRVMDNINKIGKVIAETYSNVWVSIFRCLLVDNYIG